MTKKKSTQEKDHPETGLSRADRRRLEREKATARRRERRESRARSAPRPAAWVQSLPFTGLNAALGGAGVASVSLGYFLLAQGSITAAPLLLVLGYCVLLPLALVL